MSITYKYRCT